MLLDVIFSISNDIMSATRNIFIIIFLVVHIAFPLVTFELSMIDCRFQVLTKNYHVLRMIIWVTQTQNSNRLLAIFQTFSFPVKFHKCSSSCHTGSNIKQNLYSFSYESMLIYTFCQNLTKSNKVQFSKCHEIHNTLYQDAISATLP